MDICPLAPQVQGQVLVFCLEKLARWRVSSVLGMLDTICTVDLIAAFHGCDSAVGVWLTENNWDGFSLWLSFYHNTIPRKQTSISESSLAELRFGGLFPCRCERSYKCRLVDNFSWVFILICGHCCPPRAFKARKESHGCITWEAFSSKQYKMMPYCMQLTEAFIERCVLWPSTNKTMGFLMFVCWWIP